MSRASFVLLASLPLLLLSTSGCDCEGETRTTCTTSASCRAGTTCIDGFCAPIPDVGPIPDGSTLCSDGRLSCGAACCEDGMSCVLGACRVDCGAEPLCGGVCCGDGQACESNRCVAVCDDPASRCGVASDVCCGDEEACLRDACVALGGSCAETEDCDLEEICDPALGRCLPRSAVDVCEYRPPVGTFAPTIGCRWLPPAGARTASNDVVMAPAVANLTDDNGDGVTDVRDVPDIVLISFDYPTDSCCTARGTLRVVDGRCGEDGSMRTIATILTPFLDNSSGVALGNLHPDSMAAERAPEIVATRQNMGTIAFRRTADDGSTWEIMWENTSYLGPGRYNGSGAAPALADLNGDGQPEVIVGNVVLNGLDGTLVWDGNVTGGPGVGVGNNAFLGPTSTVADIDLDGVPEVIAGNTVYDGRNGTVEWTYTYTTSNSACGGSVACDGYNAIGNFDDDDEGEVVIVRRGELFVLEHDGTLKTQVTIPRDDCANNEGGPPTVADFDGDGRAEIGVASADFYVVFDLDCTGSTLPAGCAAPNVLWQVPNTDCSSRSTGSSVFDFDGDGRAEVVYADERNFRILSGTDGTILFDDTAHRSNTRLEMPIVVDVDNDGKSEVLVPEAPAGGGGGLIVWTDMGNNWVRTRRIWNQHSYHVTNISEDGIVPRIEEPNWLHPRYNHFRQNVQPAGLFDAPDLVIEAIERETCNSSTETVEIAVVVGNHGALAVAPGVPVVVVVTPTGGAAEVLPVQLTTTYILPGGTERMIFTWMPAGGFSTETFDVEVLVDSDGMGGSEYNECLEDNNGAMGELMTCSFG